jgi:hypothetical protein
MRPLIYFNLPYLARNVTQQNRAALLDSSVVLSGGAWGRPPADLEDPVPQQVHATALAALSPGDLPSRLLAAQASPFAFVAALDPMSDVADLSALLATFARKWLASGEPVPHRKERRSWWAFRSVFAKARETLA